MLEGLIKKIFGDPNEKELKNIRPIVDKINALEPDMERMSDANLQAKTSEFKLRLKKGETLDDILPEAFAVVREASKRVTGMRHFDVQLIGGVVLHRGKISEMRTGEGKTLVATAFMWSPSTIIWPAATVSIWAVSIISWACPSA